MPRSMTAFARKTITFDWGSMTCELRSVNHRFLETGFRLPETLRDVEMKLRDIARKRLARGKVDCVLQFNLSSADRGQRRSSTGQTLYSNRRKNRRTN